MIIFIDIFIIKYINASNQMDSRYNKKANINFTQKFLALLPDSHKSIVEKIYYEKTLFNNDVYEQFGIWYSCGMEIEFIIMKMMPGSKLKIISCLNIHWNGDENIQNYECEYCVANGVVKPNADFESLRNQLTKRLMADGEYDEEIVNDRMRLCESIITYKSKILNKNMPIDL